ncbi:AraC family transcriptional regulator [Mycolicibacterium sp. P9-64]|uniref:helix-turn-helix transcriptional regulator n=1 Tax=Mycolicibacterium sp. P9-64 TaxID=2024612 RepID=UPI0011F05D97|nr:AraC family transcriptional regulator [Mycolicibacterium sp. P9-64]KAA0079834.1 AraC family transcriptional regulator [Mycolicibacterium sp. P9-64]
MPEFVATPILATGTTSVWNVMCPGHIRPLAEEECATTTHLVFPYRGVYVHHVGSRHTVVDASQVLFINEDEPYRVSHPVDGGDSVLSIRIEPDTLRELTPTGYRHPKGRAAFDRLGIPADTRTQHIAATVRQRLRRGSGDALEAEELTLELVRHTLGENRWSAPNSTGAGPRRLADRVKLLLSSDVGRRWTLSDVAASVGVSPVYLTQAFKHVEGVPLYRYHLRLRLARSLDLLADCDDLTDLALALGFTSHSHFTAAFGKVYGVTPSGFQRSVAS